MVIAIVLLTFLFSLSAVSSGGERDSLFISGSWDSSLGTCILPGTTDENRLGERNTDTLMTSGLTRLYRYKGAVTYRRTVDIPASFRGRNLFLELERTRPAVLCVDGDTVGFQRSILTPHVYRLPGLSPGKHEISLTVDNSSPAVPEEIMSSHAVSESTQTNWNGVIGKMFIEARPQVYISSMNVYPDVSRKEAEVRLIVVSDRDTGADFSLCAVPEPCDSTEAGSVSGTIRTRLSKGENVVRMTLDMGEDALLWSEFHPHLYRFEASLKAGRQSDALSCHAGMRDFSTEGTSFTINGHKVFLRGKHDACVFPLTGYPPMDVSSWRKVFSTAREYGINHYRFHSWTPPEAAFRAADLEGIYLQVELPLWGAVQRDNEDLNEFLTEEARRILDEYGNHPSFVMFSLGNELHGDTSLMREWTEELRKSDGRHLYCFGSNNNLGWEGPQEGEDFFVACRVGWGEGYSSHTRTTFAMVDAENGGIMNNTRPGTCGNYSKAISGSPVPVVSHENCQFQIYPDYSEIRKYTGVLYPYNLEAFKSRLYEAGMGGCEREFCEATGRFAAECFKYDLEYAFRTPGFGGFQMLDLQDYPGQGTALVGVLDAFMDSKGVITPEKFREFCSPVVLLAEFDSCCLSAGDTLDVAFKISDYLETAWNEPLEWRLSAGGNCISGRFDTCVPQGTVTQVGCVSVPVKELLSGLLSGRAFSAELELQSAGRRNSYRLWVYPEVSDTAVPAGVEVVTSADDRLRALLEEGRRVVLVPSHDDIAARSVGGMFTPDFWNWSMFKSISESAGKPVSPGTLSVVNDPSHPLFSGFPNEGHSDWQWWSICLNSRPLVMDELMDYTPLLQVIDNIERCHKLGIIAEFTVGNGSLLVCTTDLEAVSGTPEGASFRNSLMRYVSSEDFHPSYTLEWDELLSLLYGDVHTRDIQGVENTTDYSDYL